MRNFLAVAVIRFRHQPVGEAVALCIDMGSDHFGTFELRQDAVPVFFRIGAVVFGDMQHQRFLYGTGFIQIVLQLGAVIAGGGIG